MDDVSDAIDVDGRRAPKCKACDSPSVCGLEYPNGDRVFWCRDHAQIQLKCVMDFREMVGRNPDPDVEAIKIVLDKKYPGLLKDEPIRIEAVGCWSLPFGEEGLPADTRFGLWG